MEATFSMSRLILPHAGTAGGRNDAIQLPITRAPADELCHTGKRDHGVPRWP